MFLNHGKNVFDRDLFLIKLQLVSGTQLGRRGKAYPAYFWK